jgi:hypothetical protein
MVIAPRGDRCFYQMESEGLMTGGLLAPLSPCEEIALRRIAYGSFVVEAKAASRLIALALIENTGRGMRLTPLGRLRFNALPKAPLLARPRSVHAVTGYVEGLIEKAQMRAARPQGPAAAPPPATIPAPASPLPETQGEAVQERDAAERPVVHQPMYFFDSDDWKSSADRALTRSRRAIMEHRRRQISLCDASVSRSESSRSLLRDSVPVRPGWLDAAK